MSGSASEVQAAWFGWIQEIDPDERAVVAELMERHELDSLVSINAFARDVMIGIFKGRLSPVVASAARPWLELICTNVHAMTVNTGGGKEEMIRVLLEARRTTREIEPAYTKRAIEDQGDVINAFGEDLELVDAGDEGIG
jgi:hypothetical protein